jgi:hypothetical protein
LRSITSMLMQMSCIYACRSHHNQIYFHTHTQTQPKRAASIRLSRFRFFEGDFICSGCTPAR